ncbi:hypothetical protein JR316_0006167 [Psilocybe cubensis]|uniref:ThuA-like domain-containing protein n=2 Tax=Psilocybe cubensis TaxID=181762 RepID=A0A8H7Y396_PSICU|nr:hypothetical protein JR316_0006167 [Psilocybe cubensis]KAH9481640.1 hypothetical protein JR316_0006167 [Psilocybe cubensis]
MALYTQPVSASSRPQILLYTATTGFRHDSIPVAIAALKAKEDEIDIDFFATEDPAQFTDESLARFDAVLFLSTTGDVLDAAGEAAFQRYLNLGGNFVGIHSAAATLENTTCYVRELGAVFDYHPELQNFTVDVLQPSHPSASMLPAQWTVADEVYNFKSDPRALGAVVVLSANKASYHDPVGSHFDQGEPHPTAWFQEHGAGVQKGGVAGRSFYTSLGHLNETWQNELFLEHILGGISWVLQANTTRGFNVNGRVGNPMSINSKSVTTSMLAPQSSNEPNAQHSGTQGNAFSASQVVTGVATLLTLGVGQILAKKIKLI